MSILLYLFFISFIVIQLLIMIWRNQNEINQFPMDIDLAEFPSVNMHDKGLMYYIYI